MESECIHELSADDSKSLPRGLRRRIRRLSTNPRNPLLSKRASTALGLSILPAGEPNQDAVRVLGVEHDFIETVQSEFDLVIIDLPPILSPEKNNLNLASLDGNLFVIKAEQTTDRTTQKSIRAMQQRGGVLTGVVLNQCRKRFSRRNSSSAR